MSRRRVIQGCAAASTVGLAALATAAPDTKEESESPAIKKGRLNQSVCSWCFAKHWDLEQTCRIAKQLGCTSVELVPAEHWPVLKKHGLICAMANSHGYVQGMNKPEYHAMCQEKIRETIDACVEFGFPNVITFTGFREDVPDDVGISNCVKGLKGIVGDAETKKITLCIEMLNSRVDVDMKGHPGYQGDHTDYCIEIIRQVGSPRMKLLFDIYHVQIMDGDIIARIRQYCDYIGHYHTAGNPGRCELDDRQEINYKAIMEEIAGRGYKGYVGQEFIPTRDPLAGLRQAVTLCDV
jgi:hydroxypyruvate isomerase